MKTVDIQVAPYCNQSGRVEIPDNVTEDEVRDYILEHIEEVSWGDPEISYEGDFLLGWEYTNE